MVLTLLKEVAEILEIAVTAEADVRAGVLTTIGETATEADGLANDVDARANSPGTYAAAVIFNFGVDSDMMI